MQKVPDTFDESYRKQVDDNLRYLFLGQKPDAPVTKQPSIQQSTENVRILWDQKFLRLMVAKQQMKVWDFYDAYQGFDLDKLCILAISTPHADIDMYLIKKSTGICLRQIVRDSSPTPIAFDIPLCGNSLVERIIHELNECIAGWKKRLG